MNELEIIKPEKTLGERIHARGSDLTRFAQELDSSEELSEVFTEQLSNKHLHIVVQRPSRERDTP